jgi:hypothetical protein
VIAVLLLAAAARAQQPFYTDDANVTELGRFHFEWSNQFNWLQHSARPALRQNTADFELDYGLLWPGLELSLESPVIAIVNSERHGERSTVAGFGDTNVGLKYEFIEEQPDDPWPAVAASLNLEFPTGNTRQGLGSGLIDLYTNSIVQKTIAHLTFVRANLGFQFVGDQTTGVLGLRTRGFVVTAGASLVRDFTARLKLGLETFAAVSDKFAIRRGLLQLQAGGNYELVEGFSLDFGIIRGFYGASPRAALQLGFSLDF